MAREIPPPYSYAGMEMYTVSSAFILKGKDKDTYENWSVCLKSYLLGQGLWDIIESNSEHRTQAWGKRNAMALNAIQISCAPYVLSRIKNIDLARDAWITLKNMFAPQSPSDEQPLPEGDADGDADTGMEMYKDTYENWSVCLKSYLLGQGLWDVIESNSKPRKPVELEAWTKRNAMALHAIQISCAPYILSKIRKIDSASKAWFTLADMFVPQSPLPRGRMENESTHLLELYKYAHKGDLVGVERVLSQHPGAEKAKIPPNRGTALHAAAYAENMNVVEELVQRMSREDLEIRDNDGNTVLSIGAHNGNMKIVECLVNKNSGLVHIVDGDGSIPLVMACARNYKDVTRYLYSITPPEILLEDNGKHGSQFLQHCIVSQMFDLAVDLLRKYTSLATAMSSDGSNLLVQLSEVPDSFFSGCELTIWQRLIYYWLPVQVAATSNCICIHIIDQGEALPVQVHAPSECVCICNIKKLQLKGFKQMHDLKHMHIHSKMLLPLIRDHILTLNVEEYTEAGVYKAFHKAIKYGTVEIVTELVKTNPDLMYAADKNGRNLFQSSIAYRQEKVFSLLYGVKASRIAVTSVVDNNKNTMLHLAAMLSPASQLDRISGAALQMQRELQWYKEVESVINPLFKARKNKNGERASQLFSRSHKDLRKEGEKWMKATATSSTVVGALIITVTFAAAFTVPDRGDKKSFKTFIMSDAISLFAASTSVLMFLGVLTSRYSEQDFLKSLPKKLIIGLSALFISIASMMVAFCATLMIVLKGQLRIAIPIFTLAGVPITFFMFLQFPLLVEVFKSTYGSGIFNRKMKQWY